MKETVASIGSYIDSLHDGGCEVNVCDGGCNFLLIIIITLTLVRLKPRNSVIGKLLLTLYHWS